MDPGGWSLRLRRLPCRGGQQLPRTRSRSAAAAVPASSCLRSASASSAAATKRTASVRGSARRTKNSPPSSKSVRKAAPAAVSARTRAGKRLREEEPSEEASTPNLKWRKWKWSARGAASAIDVADARFEQLLAPRFDDLPEEVLLIIMGHLSLPERVRVRAVCRRWHYLCHTSLCTVRHVNLSKYFQSPPLHRPTTLTDQRFKQLLTLLPNLHKLELGAAGSKLSRNGILSIGELCPSLIDLDISCLRLSFRALENLCRNCPRLQRVNVPRFTFKEQSLEVLFRCLTELRSLELTSSFVTGDCFHMLPASIQKVTLKTCMRIRSSNLQQIGDRCPQLAELCLSRTAVNSDTLRYIATRCCHLSHLDISSCSSARLEDFVHLMPALKSLSAGGCQTLQWRTFQALVANCSRLEKLDLSGDTMYKDISSGCLKLLGRLPQLRWLDLSYQCDVTDGVLHALTDAPRLETLLLRENYNSRSSFTEDGIVDVSVGCVMLKSLDITSVQVVTTGLYDKLLEAVPSSRALTLIADYTRLEPLADYRLLRPHVRLSVGDDKPDTLAVVRDDPWSDDDSESEADDGDRFVDVFADWLWMHNALWPH